VRCQGPSQPLTRSPSRSNLRADTSKRGWWAGATCAAWLANCGTGRTPTGPPNEVRITVDGEEYRGTYRFVPGRIPAICVSTIWDEEYADLRDMPAEVLARLVLRDLVNRQRGRAGGDKSA
jgi:hypothetical protein